MAGHKKRTRASTRLSAAAKPSQLSPEKNYPAEHDEPMSEQVDFEHLVGVGEHSDEDSAEEGAIEMMSIADIPPDTVQDIRNDEAALSAKLSSVAVFRERNTRLWESLSITMPLEGTLKRSLAMNDLERERKFVELATTSAHIALDRLRKKKTKFRRPGDYFAEMVKSDEQMAKVKARLIHHKDNIEGAENRRNNRVVAKKSKVVRGEQLERQQEKKRKAKGEVEAIQKLRKQRVKDRADGKGRDSDGDEFPIDLLEVEQLGDDNKFKKQMPIVGGKKKDWKESGADSGTKRTNQKPNRRDSGRPGGKRKGMRGGEEGKGRNEREAFGKNRKFKPRGAIRKNKTGRRA